MPSRMVNFKKHLQFSSLDQQISEINLGIDRFYNFNNMVIVRNNIDRNFSALKELKTLRRKIILDNKEMIILLCICVVLINSMSLN